MRRLVARLLLALSVAALAPGGYLHALTHLGDELGRSHQKGDAAPQAQHGCAHCAAYSAADGGAATPATFTLLVSSAATPVGRPAEPLLPPTALTRFASRAPPLPA